MLEFSLLTASPPDRNLVLTANLARKGLTAVLSSTCKFSEYPSETAQRSEVIRSFAFNLASALRSTRLVAFVSERAWRSCGAPLAP
jgi:hypothetical protein